MDMYKLSEEDVRKIKTYSELLKDTDSFKGLIVEESVINNIKELLMMKTGWKDGDIVAINKEDVYELLEVLV